MRLRFATCAIAAALTAAVSLLAPHPAQAGYASIVIDEGTGDVLNEVNADQVNHPASLTKMMTLYLAFDALKKGHLQWDQPLRVSSWAAAKAATKLGLEPGSTITVRECVLGMIVLSANDAATVMAETLGGTEDGFAGLMTQRAYALGMTSTTFVNASGLPDEDQVTSARDLAKLAVALYEDFPDQYHFFSTHEFLFHGRLIVGHNRLMYRYAGMDGLKTGYTTASGFNLASSAVRDGRRLFGVVLGGESAPARDRLMAQLLDDGFAGHQTDPMLVAQAGGQNPRPGHRLLVGAEKLVAALSPVTKAEAAPLPRATMLRVRPPAAQTPVLQSVWSVQVGAYSKEAQAKQTLQNAVKVAGLGGHDTAILPPPRGERIYRARIQDFSSEKQARDACQLLHNKRQICTVVPPGGSGIKLASTRR